MSDLNYQCPLCYGYGCAWCDQTGTVTADQYRAVKREHDQMDDDRDWARERDRRSGAHCE